MGRIFLEYVPCDLVHVCSLCRTHLADHESIVSKVSCGRKERRVCAIGAEWPERRAPVGVRRSAQRRVPWLWLWVAYL
jgi:hypothetical protein